jgi:hypothetical protein
MALPVALAAALAACADAGPPAPGEKPGWPQPTPPLTSLAPPSPFPTMYAPLSGQVEQLPPVAKGENVPYYVVKPLPKPAE